MCTREQPGVTPQGYAPPMALTLSATALANDAEGPAPPMIPGNRESRSLTRFAPSPGENHSMVDVTMDAATIADRQREGGGAKRERIPARVPAWRTVIHAIRRA